MRAAARRAPAARVGPRRRCTGTWSVPPPTFLRRLEKSLPRSLKMEGRELTSLLFHAPWAAKSYHQSRKRRGARANLLVQPSTRVSPVALRRRHGDAEHLRCFLERAADKIAQLDDFSLAGVMSGEPVQRFIDCQRLLLVAQRRGDLQFVHIDMFRPAAAFVAMLPSRPLDENPPHGLGSRGEEMRSIGKDSIAQA